MKCKKNLTFPKSVFNFVYLFCLTIKSNFYETQNSKLKTQNSKLKTQNLLSKGKKNIIFLFLSIFCYLNVFAQLYYVSPKKGEAILPNPYIESNPSGTGCNMLGSSSPCPYDDSPVLYIRVNLHYILTQDGKGNFTETGDNDGASYNGYQRAEDIINEANRQLEENTHEWGGAPDLAVCKINVRLVLEGVYFQRTNIGLASTNPVRYNWQTFFAQYVQDPSQNAIINGSTEVNCFFFNATLGSGVANGTHTSVHDDWLTYQQFEKNSPSPQTSWARLIAARVLLHEVFHNSGLWKHPFQLDLCDDTPTFDPPCWEWSSDPNDPCHLHASNNLMDYNAYADWSLSPCQVCNLYSTLSGSNFVTTGANGTLECPPATAYFDIPSEICGISSPNVWMQGSASHNESDYAIEVSQVQSVGSPVNIAGTLVRQEFTGLIGNINLKTHLNYSFGCDKIYKVKLIATNCEVSDEMTKYVTINCGCPGLTATNTASTAFSAINVSPNPVTGIASIQYTTSQDRNIAVSILNLNTGGICTVLQPSQFTSQGTYTLQWNADAFPDGVYAVRFTTETEIRNVQIYISR